MSVCCLNPSCDRPLNQDNTKFCQNCRTPTTLLRNQYRPIRFLGSGGFGRTFLAENIDKFNEQCVIKQLVPQVQGTWATQKAKELFEQEAKKLQKLGEHPQIPSLTAYFEQDNYWYIVQQFVEGQTLYQELEQQGIFAEEQIRKVLQELLEILKFIHQSPVIHRDLKPENVMRRHSDRQLVLIDFGIAKELAQTTLNPKSKNALGTSIGSFGYSPLEQIQGGQAYSASDLYSLGATCFHLLSGIHPCQLWQEHGYGWTADWQKQIKTPISQSLVRILTKLLQKDYQQRYQNAEQVLADLNLKIPDSTLISPPPPQPSTVKKNPPNANKQVNVNQTSSRRRQKQSVTSSRTPSDNKISSWIIYLILIMLGLSCGLFLYKEFIGDRQHDERVVIPTTQNINYLQPKSTQTLNVGDAVSSLPISDDGKTVVSGSWDGTIKIWDLATGQLKSTLTGHQAAVLSVAISGDGKTIVSGSGKIRNGSDDNTIKIWDLETGKLKSTLTGHQRAVFSVAISGDGKTIVSGSWDGTIKIWDLATGQLKSTLTGHQGGVASVAISGDGKTIVSGAGDGTIKIWDLATGQLKSTLTGHQAAVLSVAISGDGKTIVSGSGKIRNVRDDYTIRIWDLATGQLRSTLTGHQDNVYSVAISGDGKTIVSGSVDGTIKIWDLATGQLKSTLTGHQDGGVYSVAISGDGKTIVSGGFDKTIKIWRFE